MYWYRELTVKSVHTYRYFRCAKNKSRQSSSPKECGNDEHPFWSSLHCLPQSINCRPMYSLGGVAKIGIDFRGRHMCRRQRCDRKWCCVVMSVTFSTLPMLFFFNLCVFFGLFQNVKF